MSFVAPAIFALCLVVTAVITIRWGRRLDAKDAAEAADHIEEVERIRNSEAFGHPLPPVASIRAVLPDPPRNHAWEIQVRYDTAGVPHVALSLLTMPGTEVIDSVWLNLYQRRDSSGMHPWAAYYRSLPTRGDALREFKQQILGPLMDWAQLAVYRTERPGDYDIRA